MIVVEVFNIFKVMKYNSEIVSILVEKPMIVVEVFNIFKVMKYNSDIDAGFYLPAIHNLYYL